MNIFILHPGKANYPEVAAYKSFFSEKCVVLDGTLDDYEKYPDKNDTILWSIMGFYPKRLPARLVIHDYRSLSTGVFATLKDSLKAMANVKPDIRIFQNEKIRDVMGFKDRIPAILLPMGVPDWLPDMNFTPAGLRGTYCYIGEMSFERGFDKLLDAYLKSGQTEPFLLIGKPQDSLYAKYKGEPGLIFAGRMPQEDALAAVARSDYAISYFPYHRPHKFQTPTKLLEYAALGVRVIANDAPGNVNTAKSLDIKIGITGRDIFSDSNRLDEAKRQPALSLDPRHLTWQHIIKNSGIEARIDQILA